MAEHIDIVLDDKNTTGAEPFSRFIEIEVDGKSVRIGKVVLRTDGLWALRITRAEIDSMEVQ